MMCIAMTRIVESMFQVIQWIVSKLAVFDNSANVIILRMFIDRSRAIEVSIAYSLVLNGIGVERCRKIRR